MGTGRGQKKVRKGRSVRGSGQQDIIDARARTGGFVLDMQVKLEHVLLLRMCTYVLTLCQSRQALDLEHCSLLQRS